MAAQGPEGRSPWRDGGHGFEFVLATVQIAKMKVDIELQLVARVLGEVELQDARDAEGVERSDGPVRVCDQGGLKDLLRLGHMQMWICDHNLRRPDISRCEHKTFSRSSVIGEVVFEFRFPLQPSRSLLCVSGATV